MKIRTTFICDYCANESEDRAEIEACEATPLLKAPAKPGDVVIIGTPYHWWDPRKRVWFHLLPEVEKISAAPTKEPMGYPKFVVVGIAPYRSVSRNISGGPWCHKEAMLLYSPEWANGAEDAYCWACSIRQIVGDVSESQLDVYRKAVKGRAPVCL